MFFDRNILAKSITETEYQRRDSQEHVNGFVHVPIILRNDISSNSLPLRNRLRTVRLKIISAKSYRTGKLAKQKPRVQSLTLRMEKLRSMKLKRNILREEKDTSRRNFLLIISLPPSNFDIHSFSLNYLLCLHFAA